MAQLLRQPAFRTLFFANDCVLVAAMSLFDDSDDDLMVPLSQRLALHTKKETITLCSSSSSSRSSVAEATVTTSDKKKDKEKPKTLLRRCVTLNDFSPVVKLKKKNTPAKANVIEKEKECVSLSNSFSSCLTLSSASGKSHEEIVASSSSATVTQKPVSRKVTASSSNEGRAPIRKLSSRDCQALICAHFLTKHFKDEEIQKVFAEYEVRFRYDSNPILDYSITFVREFTNEYDNIEERPEDHVILVIGKDELVRMVHQYKIVCAGDTVSPSKGTSDDDEDVIPIRSSSDEDDVIEEGSSQQEEDLVIFVGRISQMHPDKNITLIFTGMAAYFRSQKKKLDESYNDYMRGKTKKKRKRKNDTVSSVSPDDLNEALIDLQIRYSDVMQNGKSVNHYVIEKMSDILSLIAAITKSVAEAPSKRTQKELSSMDWFAENDKGASVDLKDMEKDSLRLWRKQLEQFPKVSREVADAIAKAYPTVRSLMNAYNRLDEACGRILLQDLPVGKSGRRVGPEISRKIHLFFTSRDGSIFLGKDV